MRKYVKKIFFTVLAAFVINARFLFPPACFSAQDSVELAKNLYINNKQQEAVQILSSELKQHPNSTMALIELARIYLNENRFSEAKALLNKAFKLEPQNPQIYSLTADLFYKNSQISQAEKIAQKALEINPDDSEALILIGKIQLQKAQMNSNTYYDPKVNLVNQAMRSFKMASKNNPSSPEAHIGLAKVYIAAGKDDMAFNELLIAEELGFTSSDVLYSIGESYYKLGKYEKSLKMLTKPEVYSSKKNYRAHFILGNIYEKFGDPDLAQKEYRISLKYNSGDLESKVRLQQLQEDIASLDGLQNISASKSVQEKPKGESLISLADYYLIMERLGQARELYRTVLEKEPNNLRARIGLCELYYSQWVLGYFNPVNFFPDSVYFENNIGSPDLIIPAVKVKITGNQELSAPVREELKRISGNAEMEKNTLMNAARASFLLGNYQLSDKIINSMLLSKLSDYDKFQLAKNLYLDQDYFQAEAILKTLQKNYPDEVINSILSRIYTKRVSLESLIREGESLYRKKDYKGAQGKYVKAVKTYPSSASARFHLASVLNKLGSTDKAREELTLYQILKSVYPDETAQVPSGEYNKLINVLK